MPEINITKTIYVDAEPVTPVNKPSSIHENVGQTVNPVETKNEVSPAFENVVAVSDDGDTVQARPESYDRLSDGFVFNKTKEAERTDDDKEAKVSLEREQNVAKTQAAKNASVQEERKEERIREQIREAQERADEAKEILQDQIREKDADTRAADRKAQTQISYTSMSDSELERMYLTGQISSYAYNQEIDSRKDKIEDSKQENAELSATEVQAQVGLEANESLRRNVTGEEFGSGYETREEREAVQDALYGKTIEDNNTSNAAFEVNLTR
ncbi:MAG: hypothetical protein J6X94_04670 [Lachnospiraceae bacterium]|nr:hypothetical protein [Lachnospiraceae bacterium]